MPWTRRAGSNRKEIVHIVVTGYQKKKEPRKHYVRFCNSTYTPSGSALKPQRGYCASRVLTHACTCGCVATKLKHYI